MPRTEIKYNDYKVKAFLDTNIILEGRSLIDLPWEEIDTEGPIIVLLTPTALREVDSKKQDGRIGKRAREFNRFIAPAAAGGPPIVIRERNPRVELALARATRIPWDQHDDLDPEDGDSCIVAEALHAKDITDAGKLLVSNDIKPIAFAANYNLETLHVSENWLRQMEPGPADKEIQRLKSKLAEYEKNQPEFGIRIEILNGEPVSSLHIKDLTDVERDQIERKIFATNPKQSQMRNSNSIMSSFDQYDNSYDDRYEAYKRRIPVFMANYAQRLERLFNQTRFKVTVSNIGKVQAENLLVEVKVSSGWLHDRYVFISPSGPTAPKPKNRMDQISDIMHRMPLIPPRTGRHEVAFKDEPHWRSWFSVTCEDFRHGQDWPYDGVVGIDPRAPETKIIVTVTASNFRGKVQEAKLIDRAVETSHFSKLIDQDTLQIIADTPINEVIRMNDYDEAIDWGAFTDDDDD